MRGLDTKKREGIICQWAKDGLSYRQIAKNEGICVGTVQKTIKRFTEHYTLKDLPGRGKKKGATRPDLDKKVLATYKRRKEISVRDCALKCGTTIGMVQRAKRRANLKTYKKQKRPKRSKIQNESVKTRSRKLYRHILKKKESCIIMDDETYVKMDYKTLPGPQFYTTVKSVEVPNSEKSIFCEKFGKKVLVWQAICQCGKVSSPFFTTDNLNHQIYLKECLQKRLLPLIRSHKAKPLFWPDLASCHYAKSVVNWYEKQNIEYVKKEMNPPNCPEVRPIEKFWAVIKSDLKKIRRPADTMEKFKSDWNRVVKKRGETLAKNLMKDIHKKLNAIASDV